MLTAEVTGVGADWVALETGRSVAVLLPLASISAIGMPHADVLRSARPAPARSALADRMTFGFVVRDLVRRRVAVTVQPDARDGRWPARSTGPGPITSIWLSTSPAHPVAPAR